MTPDTQQPAPTDRPGDRPDDKHDAQREVMVECRVETRRRRLDVEWTNGAVFYFPSREHARRWTAIQSAAVPGQFTLDEPADTGSPLAVDLVVSYDPTALDDY
jgi:hypothetical protein